MTLVETTIRSDEMVQLWLSTCFFEQGRTDERGVLTLRLRRAGHPLW
ncbi:MAG: hypothetical protein Kow0047_19310 [Anaerolineae bacterium]